MNKLVNPLIFILSVLLGVNLCVDIARKLGDDGDTKITVTDESDIRNVMESQKTIDEREKRIHELELTVAVHRSELATMKAKVPSIEFWINDFKHDTKVLNEWHDKLTRDLDNKFKFMFGKFEDHDRVMKDHAEKFDAHDAILFRHGVKIDKLEVDALPWEEIKQKKPDVICVPQDENSSEGDTEK